MAGTLAFSQRIATKPLRFFLGQCALSIIAVTQTVDLQGRARPRSWVFPSDISWLAKKSLSPMVTTTLEKITASACVGTARNSGKTGGARTFQRRKGEFLVTILLQHGTNVTVVWFLLPSQQTMSHEGLVQYVIGTGNYMDIHGQRPSRQGGQNKEERVFDIQKTQNTSRTAEATV